MLKGETILIIGHDDWEMWRQTHEFAFRFARSNRVVFVERIKDYHELRWRGESRIGYLRRFRPPALRWINENLAVLQPPPRLPTGVSVLSRFFAKDILRVSMWMSRPLEAALLKRWLRDMDLSPTITIVTRPFELSLAGCFGEKVSCYYVYDEYALFPGHAPIADLVEQMERDNIRRVDLVFASSRSQHEKRKNLHPNVHYIPNAVDFERFHDALVSDAPGPDDLRDIPWPRIGYIGQMQLRLDFDLLQRVAKAHPEWSLVLIGWVKGTDQEKMDALRAFPNVFMLGAKPAAEMPVYVKGLDVGLIPFLVTPMTNTMYFLKLHEYLAVGLPVVSTALNEVKPFAGVVSIANTEKMFITLIEEALATNSTEKAQARVAVARENSWERRVAEMTALIHQRLCGG